MGNVELYVPQINELWFYQKMMSDPATMSYNANWDIDDNYYHKDTGCIDFPKSEWVSWYERWINKEPKRFFAYIVRSSDGAWIGNVNFHYNPDMDWWDMGIVIYAPYRGRGYSVPALLLVLDHAFRNCGISRIHNDFEVTRPGGLKAHLAAGFLDAGVENGFQHVMLTKEEYLYKMQGRTVNEKL